MKIYSLILLAGLTVVLAPAQAQGPVPIPEVPHPGRVSASHDAAKRDLVGEVEAVRARFESARKRAEAAKAELVRAEAEMAQSKAALDRLRAGKTAVPSAAELEAEREAEAKKAAELEDTQNIIPSRFRGQWSKPVACAIFTDFGAPPLDGAEIEDRFFYRFGHGCQLDQVVERGKNRFVGDFNCGISGTELRERVTLQLGKGNTLGYKALVIEGAAKDQAFSGLSRCPSK